MLPMHIGLVSELKSDDISITELTQVSAALQKQVTRDFGPLWDIDATVDAFTRLDDVPLDTWPIIIRKDIHMPGAAGVHEDPSGQPFALVQLNSGWSLTASHECLEMLADPSGNRLVAGSSVPEFQNGQARVKYLVEVCDPCEDSTCAYTINDIIVSDFLTPHFYDPRKAIGVQYDFAGAISAPRTVLQGGYVSFLDPTSKRWLQVQYFDGTPKIVDLGELSQITGNLRVTIDHHRLTRHPEMEKGLATKNPLLVSAMAKKGNAQKSASSHAQVLRGQIEQLIQREPVGAV